MPYICMLYVYTYIWYSSNVTLYPLASSLLTLLSNLLALVYIELLMVCASLLVRNSDRVFR